MDLKGEITTTELAEIFQMLTQTRKEGTLTVSHADHKKAIYFSKQGVTLLFDSDKKTGSMGQMLLDYGKVTAEQLQQALTVQKESGHRLGEILSGMGLVTQEEIEDLVCTQIQEEIFDLLSWRGGYFEFNEGLRKEPTLLKNRPLTNLVIDSNSVLMEAARRLDEWQRIETLIPSADEVPVPTEDRQGAPEGELLQKVLSAADGQSTADELVEKTGLYKFGVYTALYQLLEEGWLRLATPEELIRLARACRQRDQTEKSLRLYEVVIEHQPDNVRRRTDLARLAEELGDIPRAVRHYEWLAREHIEAERIEEAIPIFNQIKELEPGNLFAREDLFQAGIRLKQDKMATQEGRDLIEAYRNSGALEKAKVVAERLLGLAPQDTARLRALISILVDLGETAAAIAQCEQLAGILDRQGNEAALERIYEQIYALDRSRRDIRERLRHIGRRAAARRKKAVILSVILVSVVGVGGLIGFKLFKGTREARNFADLQYKAQAMEQEGSFQEAIALYRNFLEEHPDSRYAESAQTKIQELESQAGEQHKTREVKIAKLREEASSLERRGDHQNALAKYNELGSLLDGQEKAQIQRKVESLEKAIKDVSTRLAQVSELESKGDIPGARKLVVELVRAYPAILARANLELPLRLASVPSGASLSINGKQVGVTPEVFKYPPLQNLTLTITKSGFQEQTLKLKDDFDWQPQMVYLPKLATWELSTTGVIEATPLVVANTVIIGSRDGNVYAVDVETGQRRWTFKAPLSHSITSAPVLAGDKLYVTTNEGRVIAINPESGQEVWKRDTNKLMRSSPCVTPEGLVCVGSFDKNLYALDAESGEVRWKAPVAGSIQSSPRYSAGKLYFGSDDRKVHCVRAEKGEKVWEFPTQAEVRSSPWVEAGIVYVGSDDGHLYALDAKDGSEVGKFRTEGKIVSSPVVHQGFVLVGSMDGKLYAFEANPRNRWEPVWSYDTGSAITAAPTCKDDKVYVGSNDGRLYALELGTGKLLWLAQTAGPINCSPAVAEGMVIVGADDKKAYAFSL